MSADNKLSHQSTNNKEIGKTFVSEKFSSTIDSFWIVINSSVLINPFDFVSVDNKNNTKTIGIVKELQRTFLLFDSKHSGFFFSEKDQSINSKDMQGTGVTIAKIVIMTNIINNNNNNNNIQESSNINESESRVQVELKNKTTLSINMPMEEGKSVVFANSNEVIESLGIPEMENPIPAGIIQMTNGTNIPIFLDVTYILGPDTAHVNASGISGNVKTSYLLFLLQAAYQTLSKEGIALILFNTKEKGLLYLENSSEENFDKRDMDFMNLLNMKVTPFQNIKYFLPRGRNGKPNSAYIPEKNFKTYSYELSDIYDRLELLFPSQTINDPQYNISSIINYIYESWPLPINYNNNDNNDNKLDNIKNWTDLIHFNDYPEEIVTHKSTLLRFKGSIQRFRRPTTLFVDKKITSIYLGNEIKQLKKDDVFVIDIAMLSTLEEQAFVIGDVMRTIDEMYSIGHTPAESSNNFSSEKNISNEAKDTLNDNSPNIHQSKNINKDNNQDINKKPKYILILIDEINRFLPHSEFNTSSFGSGTLVRSAVAEEILKTLIAGKSRHISLLSAQQFKSQIDPTLNHNTGLHVCSKLGLSELSTISYSMIDDATKSAINKLQRGEIVLIHSAFKHPIKITIPRTAYKRT